LIAARSGPAAWPGLTARSPGISAARCVVLSLVDIERGALERTAARGGGPICTLRDVRTQPS